MDAAWIAATAGIRAGPEAAGHGNDDARPRPVPLVMGAGHMTDRHDDGRAGGAAVVTDVKARAYSESTHAP
jgi:hypothetical protein